MGFLNALVAPFSAAGAALGVGDKIGDAFGFGKQNEYYQARPYDNAAQNTNSGTAQSVSIERIGN